MIILRNNLFLQGWRNTERFRHQVIIGFYLSKKQKLETKTDIDEENVTHVGLKSTSNTLLRWPNTVLARAFADAN